MLFAIAIVIATLYKNSKWQHNRITSNLSNCLRSQRKMDMEMMMMMMQADGFGIFFFFLGSFVVKTPLTRTSYSITSNSINSEQVITLLIFWFESIRNFNIKSKKKKTKTKFIQRVREIEHDGTHIRTYIVIIWNNEIESDEEMRKEWKNKIKEIQKQ